MKAPFTKFGQTLDVRLLTWSNGQEDSPAKERWDEELWVERGEDWYALLATGLRWKTVRVVTREDWLEARAKAEGAQR